MGKGQFMKELKNKEIMIGLIALIILCVIAIGLIIKREFPKEEKMQTDSAVITEEVPMEESAQNIDDIYANTDSLEAQKKKIQTQQDTAKAGDSELTEELQKSGQTPALALNSYADTDNEFYTSPVYLEYTGEEISQLEELYYYWNEYKLEAVDDLVRLPRVRTAFTNELTGTNGFYYYGSLNANGLPDGNGLAVYENNAYYCGEWKNGKRHGKGMWLQIYPDKPSTVNGATGVVEHSYNGQWQNDLPNGKGQEHFEYDLEELEGEDIILNVIGSFKDGYYDGELYIMTIEKSGNTIDWEASAQKGVFSYYHNRYSTTGKLPVWRKMKDADEDEYRWLDELENVNWGISGLKKMN